MCFNCGWIAFSMQDGSNVGNVKNNMHSIIMIILPLNDKNIGTYILSSHPIQE